MEVALAVPIILIHLKIIHEIIKYANNRNIERNETKIIYHSHNEDTSSSTLTPTTSYSSYKYSSDSDDDLQII